MNIYQIKISTGIFGLAFSTAAIFAASPVWTGGGDNANWSTAANWDSGVAPVPGDPVEKMIPTEDSLTFGGTRQLSTHNDLEFGYFAGITFLAGGFTLDGTAPGLTGNIESTGDNTINPGLVLGGQGLRQIGSAEGGTLTINGSLNFQGASLQDNSAGIAVYNAAFTGGGIFRVFSTGSAVLGADNSNFDGAIQVFRFAKLAHPKGLGGPFTTVTLDRSYGNAALELNGLDITGVSVSFTSAEVSDSSLRARLRNTSANAATLDGDVELVVTGGIDGDGDMTLSGTISGNRAGLVKEGKGSLRLTGANTFTGGLQVDGGTVLANNTGGSAAGGGPVTVAAGATFGGTGSVAGNLILNGGSIAPGDGKIGTLTVGGNATWNGGGPWQFELGSGGASDKLMVSGNLIKGTGSGFVFDFLNSQATGNHVLLNFASSTGFAAGDFSCTNLPAGRTGTFQLTGGQLSIVVK